MKILQLCIRIPFPPNNGGSIAMANLSKAFIRGGHEVHILAINTLKHYVDVNQLPESIRKGLHLEAVTVDTSIKPLAALLNLFSNNSYNIERFISADFEQQLIKTLSRETYDVVQLESIFMVPYLTTIRKYSKALVVLRSHNVEYQIWERLATSCSNPIKKWYLKLLTRRLKAFELGVLNQYDAIVAISERDALSFKNHGCTLPIQVTPVGVHLDDYHTKDATQEFPGLFHMGAMDWLPNIEGIQWFLDHIWADLRQVHPDLQLHLAGRHIPETFKTSNIPGVIVVGEVPDAITFMGSKTIMLVPLLSGGGMRVKIVEGMALGKTIVSTSIGAEGIPCTNEKDILIGDTPEAFKHQILKCLRDQAYCIEIGKQARSLVAAHFDTTAIGKNLIGFYQELIKKGISNA